ncbi:MAG: hypothetical protein U1E73_08735 [Planctomycetota bacterium]
MPAGEAGWSDAAGVAIDEHFHLYVADPHNQVVRHFSAFGRHLGDYGSAPPAQGDRARDRRGVLDRPHAVAVAGDTVLVAGGDKPARAAVQRFRRDGRALSPLACEGNAGWRFGAPRAVAAAGAEWWVADTQNGRVQRFRRDGTFVAAFACAEPGALARPTALARDAEGAVLVVDRGDRQGFRRFSVEGRPLPLPPELEAACEQPLALAVDEQGRLHVLDQGGERVQRFTADFAFDDTLVDLVELLDDYQPSPGHHQ